MTAPSLLDVAQLCLFLAGMACGWVVRAVYAEERKIESPGREAFARDPGPVPEPEKEAPWIAPS